MRDGSVDASAVQPAVTPPGGAAVFLGQLGMETVGERDETRRVSPEGEETTGFPRRSGRDGCRLENSDTM